MEKQDFLKILEASLLLFDDEKEEEVVRLTDEFSVSCAKYITKFIKSYKK